MMAGQDDQSEEASLLYLTCVIDGTEAGGNPAAELEEKIALALGLANLGRVSVLEVDDDGRALFMVDAAEKEEEEDGGATSPPYARILNDLIERDGAAVASWLGTGAQCAPAEMEEEVLIDEEDALRMWRDLPEDGSRTAHLDPVPSPDGVLVAPTHDCSASSSSSCVTTPRARQLGRDPHLFDFDNVPRYSAARLAEVPSWTEPVIITGCLDGLTNLDVDLDGERSSLTVEALVRGYGDAEVRTGSRNTLVEHGFGNSRPMKLRDALVPGVCVGGDPECGRVVFSPVGELPEQLRRDLRPLIDAFPDEHPLGLSRKKKFTLCIGTGEGFGIGFHRHSAAMFMLVAGRKKWYMAPREVEHDVPTHPGFYTTKSTHKCIQVPGEVLYVPDQWYHEIYNLEHTRGIQALSDE